MNGMNRLHDVAHVVVMQRKNKQLLCPPQAATLCCLHTVVLTYELAASAAHNTQPLFASFLFV
jgi:hypothetical protein